MIWLRSSLPFSLTPQLRGIYMLDKMREMVSDVLCSAIGINHWLSSLRPIFQAPLLVSSAWIAGVCDRVVYVATSDALDAHPSNLLGFNLGIIVPFALAAIVLNLVALRLILSLGRRFKANRSPNYA